MNANSPSTMTRRLIKFIGSIVLGGAGFAAQATTECALAPESFYVGQGHLWVNFVGGQVGVVQLTYPDYKSILAVVTAAVLTQRSVGARFAEDNVNCAGATINSLVGVWLHR